MGNKVDIASDEQVDIASTVAKGLNEHAALRTVEYGRVSPKDFFPRDTQDSTDSSHSPAHDQSCSDPGCTDTSHSHFHGHSSKTDTSNLGISNFVYKASVPFHPVRILSLLYTWPVPIK